MNPKRTQKKEENHHKRKLFFIFYTIKRDDDGIESTRTIGRETLRDQQRRRNDYSTVRGHRGLGLGAGVRPRREQRLFEMELPGDAELYAQRDFGSRRVQGLCDFFYIGLERKREREREGDLFSSSLSFFLSLFQTLFVRGKRMEKLDRIFNPIDQLFSLFLSFGKSFPRITHAGNTLFSLLILNAISSGHDFTVWFTRRHGSDAV